MIKQQLLQKGQHKLSPQQIKLMKLVQLSVVDFEQKVQKELEENPALEEESYFSNEISSENEKENINIESSENEKITQEENINLDLSEIEDYFSYDEIEEYKFINKTNLINKIHVVSKCSFQEYLKNQLHTFKLSPNDILISDFILGNIDNNGYLRREINSIINDIFLMFKISVNEKKINKLLIKYIQKLEPDGIGARNLQECLLIQLEKKKINEKIILAKKIINDHFESFVKKHYEKIQKKLGLNKDKLREILYQIKKLNPKPGKLYSENYRILDSIIPDFTISIIDEKLELTINQRNIPELKISPLYIKMYKNYTQFDKKDEKTIIFIKDKINSAKWFVDAVKQRKNTLMLTMNAIMNYQKEYFFTGDPLKIRPMILKDISQYIGVGISTVSRVANSKYVSTPYGTFLVKSFFSEKMKNVEGENISSIEIKKIIGESISKENKEKPLTDEKLSIILKKKGYLVARRTIAKYRDQMHIPISRMRKMI
ncbi:RNA polymerase factor sigma-54 [Blattabacterium cuenoti]|uniref:RNA polymerase factor sigma-54 n=1 Tax=Blattabacterium cuenoti TaxID=1653831 RepID=UPI00163CDC97|nr:RNA polymerase factor sigma-54 [Blattabacterium cuenoti]